MISSDLELLWAHANLVVTLWLSLFEFFSSVQLFTSAAEVLLHQVDVIAVVLLLSSWVFNNQDTIFVKRICNLFAEILDLLGFSVLVHEFFQVYDRDVLNFLNLRG